MIINDASQDIIKDSFNVTLYIICLNDAAVP